MSNPWLAHRSTSRRHGNRLGHHKRYGDGDGRIDMRQHQAAADAQPNGARRPHELDDDPGSVRRMQMPERNSRTQRQRNGGPQRQEGSASRIQQDRRAGKHRAREESPRDGERRDPPIHDRKRWLLTTVHRAPWPDPGGDRRLDGAGGRRREHEQEDRRGRLAECAGARGAGDDEQQDER